MQVRGDEALLKGHGNSAAAAQSRIPEIQQLIMKAWGRSFAVRVEPYDIPAPADAAPQPARRPMNDHPLVRQAVEQLGARLVMVQPRAKPEGS